jgi:hypothetical protein
MAAEHPRRAVLVARLTEAFAGLGSEVRWRRLVDTMHLPGPVTSLILVRFRERAIAGDGSDLGMTGREAFAQAFGIFRDVFSSDHTTLEAVLDIDQALFGDALWDYAALFRHVSRRALVDVLDGMVSHPKREAADALIRGSVERYEWFVGS